MPLQLYTVTVRDFLKFIFYFFWLELYFASKRVARDCHLVVPSHAVPCFIPTCSRLDKWFPNRCPGISSDKGTMNKNTFQMHK